MEPFKTATESWSYPEPSLLRLGGALLFSGFMYASVGSCIARMRRIQHLRTEDDPPAWRTWLYPAQRHGWRLGAPEKLGSWRLLAIISFVLVSRVRPPAPRAMEGSDGA